MENKSWDWDEVLKEFGWRSKRGYPLLDKDNNFIDGEDVRLFEDIMSSFEEARLPIEEATISGEYSDKFIEIMKVLPKFLVTNNLGELNSAERDKFENFFSKAGSGINAEDRITSLISKLNNLKNTKDVVDITKNLIMLETISGIFLNYNSQTAGFIMESLMSFIFGGIRLEIGGKGGTEITDFIADNKKYSLKVISKSTPIHGSIDLLYKNILSKGQSVTYMVIYKGKTDGSINGLEFNLVDINVKNYQNIIDSISADKIKKLLLMGNRIKEEEILEIYSKETQFEISKEKLRHIGILDLDRSKIMNIYETYIDQIRDKFLNIYTSLNNFENILSKYFHSSKKEREGNSLGIELVSSSEKIPKETKEFSGVIKK